MKTVFEEFRKRRSGLSNLRLADDLGRPANLLAWLESQPETKFILDDLRKTVDVAKIVSPHGFPPRTSTDTDVCAIGLHFLDEAKNGSHLFQTAIQIGVRGRYGNSGQAAIDEAMEAYISPLFDHIESILESAGSRITVDDAAKLRFDVLEGAGFQSAFPKTALHLKRVSDYCGQPEESGSWFHVATSCREALVAFVTELQDQGLITPAPELKQADAKGILKQLAKERSDTSDRLIDLIQAVWAYVQSNVHRQSATKQDALRNLLWTGLLISESWTLVKSPVVNQT